LQKVGNSGSASEVQCRTQNANIPRVYLEVINLTVLLFVIPMQRNIGKELFFHQSPATLQRRITASFISRAALSFSRRVRNNPESSFEGELELQIHFWKTPQNTRQLNMSLLLPSSFQQYHRFSSTIS